MAFTFKELKQLKNDIAAAMGIDSSIAARVIGYYNGGGPSVRPDVVRAMIGGDLSHVGPALVALGYDLPAAMEPGTDNGSTAAGHDLLESVHTSGSASAGPVVDDLQADNITAGPDMVPDGVGAHDGSGMAPDGLQNAPQRKESTQAAKRPTKQKKSNTSPQAVQNDLVKASHDDLCKGDVVGDLEHVQGESVNPHELPPGLYDDIAALIENYCRQQNIPEPAKMHPLQWQGVCYRVGESIKARGILRDRERERTRGGVIYDGDKLVALLALYGVICADYKQVAFTFNFQRFSGVSREYFNDYTGKGLTSSRVGIVEKAQDLQRASLVGAVTGGGSATVGNIFLSKALAGLQETVTIQHVSAASTPAAVALPVFGPDGGLLEEKRPE